MKNLSFLILTSVIVPFSMAQDPRRGELSTCAITWDPGSLCVHGGPQGVWFSSSLGSKWSHLGMPAHGGIIVEGRAEHKHSLVVRTAERGFYRIVANTSDWTIGQVESDLTNKR